MGELNTFPVSYKVQGQRIVIIGGGEEALNKARLAIKTTASVVIIAREFTSDFSVWPVSVVERSFTPSDLDGTALLFVADTGADADAAKTEARRRGHSGQRRRQTRRMRFLHAIDHRSRPLTVAVSTEGDAPVLARLVRARIEALLSPDLGAVARLAGSLRERVASLLTKPQARRFYEELVTADAPNVDALLDAHATDSAGIVWLIGAGPGAEDLLTLRAQRLLQEADVIVHDHLVPDAVIEMGRRDAERISVGKRAGHHSFTQAQINALLVRLAKRGQAASRGSRAATQWSSAGRGRTRCSPQGRHRLCHRARRERGTRRCRRHGDARHAAQGLHRPRLRDGAWRE